MGLNLNTLKLAMKGFKPSEIQRINTAGVDTETVIALSDQGYSVKDVDELIKLASEEQETTAGADGQENNEPVKPAESKPEEDNVNYKEELEKTRLELSQAQDLIKQIQYKNAAQDLGAGTQTDPNESVKAAFMGLY